MKIICRTLELLGTLTNNTQVKQDRNTAAYFLGFGNFKNLLFWVCKNKDFYFFGVLNFARTEPLALLIKRAPWEKDIPNTLPSLKLLEQRVHELAREGVH